MGTKFDAQCCRPLKFSAVELLNRSCHTNSTVCSLIRPHSPADSASKARLKFCCQKQRFSAYISHKSPLFRKLSNNVGDEELRTSGSRPHARSQIQATLQSQTASTQQTVAFEGNKQARLPNGMLINYISADDVSFLYNEIWKQRSYLQHGIQIGPGDTVIDVGANIGFFTLQAAQACPGGRVVAFEPIPSTFAALQQNVAANTSNPSSSAAVKIVNAGLSDGRSAEAEFTFYEDAAGWSTMCQDDEEVQAAMQVFLSKALSTGEGLGSSKLAPLGRWLQQRIPSPLFKRLSRLYVGRMLSRAKKVTCPLYTLSQVIADHDIRQIDLLKIDVERAELDVLKGVRKSDWPKIKQVVMEVHNVDGRLDKVVAILREHGFVNLVYEQGNTLKDSALFNLFARGHE